MRIVPKVIMDQVGKGGLWRFLDAGERTEPGDLWDFRPRWLKPGQSTEPWTIADAGYEVMGDEEIDVIRRVESYLRGSGESE